MRFQHLLLAGSSRVGRPDLFQFLSENAVFVINPALARGLSDDYLNDSESSNKE